MFAYCCNCPVINTDTNGQWSWGVVTDLLCTGFSAAISFGVGVGTYHSSGSLMLTIKTTVGVFGAINNTTNQLYYNHLSKPISSLESDPKASSYTNSYIPRWDRLDYTKQQTQSNQFDKDAKSFFSEYSLHMYAWYITSWADGKDIPKLSSIAASARKADVIPHEPDSRLVIRLFTKIWEIIGL